MSDAIKDDGLDAWKARRFKADQAIAQDNSRKQHQAKVEACVAYFAKANPNRQGQMTIAPHEPAAPNGHPDEALPVEGVEGLVRRSKAVIWLEMPV